MPKKPPKNSFYYFMQDFKEKQRHKGINYANLAEVAKAADPAWRNATPQTRAHWETVAKQERQRNAGTAEKFTSTGIPFSVIERQLQDKEEAIEYEKKDIKDMIAAKAVNERILDENFYLIDVNAYCKANSQYLIGESTVLRFSLRKGFQNFYHEVINPGHMPVGYVYDIKLGAKELGLDMPDEDSPRTNYTQILANIIDYLRQSDPNNKILPPLYTMPDKVAQVQDFILQMCAKSGEDEQLFRVYRLDTLFFTLINAIKTHKNEGFPKESLALLQLKKDNFRYTPKLGCQGHEEKEKSIECTTARTKRWAYTVLDSCCPVVGIEVKAGLHVPADYDIDKILAYKDQTKERPIPTVAGFGFASSSCDTTLNDSFSEVGYNHSFAKSTTSSVGDHSVRKNEPVRMPATDFISGLPPTQAPDLTQEEFPPLTASRGRGRNFSQSFSKMNLNN